MIILLFGVGYSLGWVCGLFLSPKFAALMAALSSTFGAGNIILPVSQRPSRLAARPRFYMEGQYVQAFETDFSTSGLNELF